MLAGSSEPVVLHLPGGLCGGVLMEHSLGTVCFLCLNWSNLMASPSFTSPMKVPELL